MGSRSSDDGTMMAKAQPAWLENARSWRNESTMHLGQGKGWHESGIFSSGRSDNKIYRRGHDSELSEFTEVMSLSGPRTCGANLSAA